MMNDSNFTEEVTYNSTFALPPHEWQHVVQKIELYYTPVLVVLGSVGNSISMLVFFSTKLRKLSSSFYLGALAISDTGFLITLFVTWLEMLDVSFFSRPGFCSLFNYMAFVCSFLSSWFVVAFTVERFVAVRYPLRRPSMCTVTRAKAVLLGLTLLGLIAFSPYAFIIHAVPQPKENGTAAMYCDIKEDWKPFANIYNYADTVVTFCLPVVVISALNASISQTVWRLARVRRSMTLLERSAPPASAEQGHRSSGRRSKVRSTSSQTKVTKMLLVVSTVFLCLNLPSYVMRVLSFVMVNGTSAQEAQQFVIIQHLLNQLFNTNFGINFALYCISGQNFRRSLVSMCCPRLHRRHDTTQVTAVSEYLRSSGSIGRRRTVTLNGFQVQGSWKDAHELLPLTK
ncbi:nociceptin receptor [Anabrus simplex]|uniref:nociceptin receptor n=1 Tax=Anabrus simplex TaxID=316456 RepID=UPI0035A38B5E